MAKATLEDILHTSVSIFREPDADRRSTDLTKSLRGELVRGSHCRRIPQELRRRDRGRDHTIVSPGWTACQDLNDTSGEPYQRANLPRTRVRYGYRRIHVLLSREGWPVNEGKLGSRSMAASR